MGVSPKFRLDYLLYRETVGSLRSQNLAFARRSATLSSNCHPAQRGDRGRRSNALPNRRTEALQGRAAAQRLPEPFAKRWRLGKVRQ